MAVSLFWRLILGYAMILVLSIGASLYAVFQLGELSQTARKALEIDYRIIAQQEHLTDAFLSEARYGGKFLLTQSPSSYDQFRQFKNDFLRYLRDLKGAGTSAETSTQLVRIEHLHQTFHNLFEQEARYIQAGQPYAQSRYQQERTRILDTALREMARLKDQLEKTLHDKLEGLSGTARAARNIAIVTTLILVVLGTALSIKISTSVTQPLLELAGKTTAKVHTGPAPFSTIPEIQELSEVFARQQNRLLQAAEHNAVEMERLSDELASRLAILKRKLNETKKQNGSAPFSADGELIDSIIEDADRLIQRCVEVSAAVAARSAVSKLEPNAGRGNSGPLMREPSEKPPTNEDLRAFSVTKYARCVASLWRQFKRQRSGIA